MPSKKLPMRKITEVLRLNARALSQHPIALSTGMSKMAVLSTCRGRRISSGRG